MADDIENTQIQVPTFTVLKNGSILKNILLLRKQNSSPNQETILLVGRHPHCNITLTHPSISRHHLRIHSIPSLKLISVVDLSSVHGTWISGKRIEAGVKEGLKEGDTVKLGGSSRVYELHWVPLSRAYDGDGRFLSTIYTIKEGEEEMNQDEKLETQISDDDLECSDLSLPDKIHDSPLKTVNQGKSLDPEFFSSSCDDTELEESNSSKTDYENGEIFSTMLVPSPLVVSETMSPIEDSNSLNGSENQLNLMGDNLSNDFEVQNHGIVKKDLVSELNCSESSCGVTEVEDSSSPKTSNENCIDFHSVSVHAPTPPVVSRTTFATDISENWLKDNLSNEFHLQSHGIIREDPCSVPNYSIFACNGSEVEHWIPWNIGNKDGLSQDISSSLNKSEDWSNWLRDNLSNEFEQLSHGTMQDDLSSGNIFYCEEVLLSSSEKESQSSETKMEGSYSSIICPQTVEKVIYSSHYQDEKLETNSSNDDLECSDLSLPEKNCNSPLKTLSIGTSLHPEYFSSSCEDTELEQSKLSKIDNENGESFSTILVQSPRVVSGTIAAIEDSENGESFSTISLNLFDSLGGNDLDLFTPDKENKNPNDCSGRSLKKTLKEDQNYCTMSTEAASPTDNDEKDIFGFSKVLSSSVKEVNPFLNCQEVLLSSSEKESQSSRTKMEGSCSSIIYPPIIEKVDVVNPFINCKEALSSSEKESQTKMEGSHSSIICPQTVVKGGEKKRWTMIVDTNTLLHDESLKHLKLLKGTRLLVPKIVIRKLMDMKNQDNFLKRLEKKVSLALKWIDECMANTKWWIHMEDEIVYSSEAESQVLDTAICLRKEITDEKIVILSNDLSLKIKAMAEGIMCEAAEEFRWSLVNPFSERFMFVGSSAIGLTWSSVDDDAVRKQKYHGCVLNGSHGFKGLKLLAYV